mgnify:CR=1 FL=1
MGMFVLGVFALFLMAFSLIMSKSPAFWANGIIKFSQAAYCHPFEILSRGVFGILFIFNASNTHIPNLIDGLGWLLLVVSVGLIIMGPDRHKRFAVWSAKKVLIQVQNGRLLLFSFWSVSDFKYFCLSKSLFRRFL